MHPISAGALEIFMMVVELTNRSGTFSWSIRAEGPMCPSSGITATLCKRRTGQYAHPVFVNAAEMFMLVAGMSNTMVAEYAPGQFALKGSCGPHLTSSSHAGRADAQDSCTHPLSANVFEELVLMVRLPNRDGGRLRPGKFVQKVHVPLTWHDRVTQCEPLHRTVGYIQFL